MVFLARLGALEALVGFGLGLWLWKTLSRSDRNLVAFLGASGALGVISAGLRIAGKHNAWVGDLWELATICFLFQALLLVALPQTRNVGKLMQLFMVAAWIAYFIFTGKFGEFSSGFHVMVCISGAGLAASALCNAGGNRKLTLLGWTVLTAFLVDILPHAACQNWLSMDNFSSKMLWTYRNAVWCLTYIGMAASLGLRGSHAD